METKNPKPLLIIMVLFPTAYNIGLIAGLVKIDFFPEKASTKFKYCLRKIWALYIALFSRYDSK